MSRASPEAAARSGAEGPGEDWGEAEPLTSALHRHAPWLGMGFYPIPCHAKGAPGGLPEAVLMLFLLFPEGLTRFTGQFLRELCSKSTSAMMGAFQMLQLCNINFIIKADQRPASLG